MGLDAYVPCRCWADGLASTPPVDPASVVEEGGCLSVESDDPDVRRSFAEWTAGRACAHAHMELVAERIANWGGHRLFQQALWEAGADHVPVLILELPDANGGLCPSSASGAALDELAWFTAHAALPPQTRLVAEDTGETIHEYVAAYDGEVAWGSGRVYGVDREGFFVRAGPRDARHELFRAMRVRQRDLGEGRVGFTDVDTGRSVTVPDGMLMGGHRRDPPERMRVVETRVTGQDFAYVVDPLTRVFRASVDTGHPVHWT